MATRTKPQNQPLMVPTLSPLCPIQFWGESSVGSKAARGLLRGDARTDVGKTLRVTGATAARLSETTPHWVLESSWIYILTECRDLWMFFQPSHKSFGVFLTLPVKGHRVYVGL